jgi:hypothetical protein
MGKVDVVCEPPGPGIDTILSACSGTFMPVYHPGCKADIFPKIFKVFAPQL